MLKEDYFKLGLKTRAYHHKDWIMNVFSLTRGGEQNYPLTVVRTDKTVGFKQGDAIEPLEGVKVDEPIFSFKDKLVLEPGDLENLTERVETTYGIALVNAIVLVYPFGDKIPFINGEVSAKQLERIIERRLVDDPKEGESVAPESITVGEYRKFVDAMFSLVGYTQLCTPSATQKSLTTDPRIPKVRKELLEKYKDRLNDPATIAEIEKVLIQMDKEWLKGDPSEGFYIQDKHYSIVRKKMYLMHGIERGFKAGGEIELIENSLDEGWDITKMPSMVNSLREGTFNRGAQTALGGEAAKFLGRVFQNAIVAEDDCGTTLGWDRLITENNRMDYHGLYQLKAGKSSVLTEEILEASVGKVLTVRSPMFCRTEGASFCAKCMGDKIAASPTSLTMHAVSVGSRIMNAMMKSMHGKKLETAEFLISDIR